MNHNNFRLPEISLFKLFLSLIFLILIVVCIIAIIFTGNINSNEKYTEFYLLNTNGEAENYPSIVEIEEEVKVIAGIINHQAREMDYKIAIYTNNNLANIISPIILNNEEKWENIIKLKPFFIGGKQLVEFILDDAAKTAYTDFKPLTLRLWLTIE